MEELIFKQFELTRGYFLKIIKTFDQDTASVVPEGFNNNIHWHIGHVLTVTEQFMFGFPKKTTHLPTNYLELFGKDTRPADWQGNIPTIAELTIQLQDQLNRIKAIPSEVFDKKLKQPIMGFETVGEVANMSVFHEAFHLGQLHTMKRVINNRVKSPS